MELNRNPENFFAEVEQAAFSPANIVPGIGFSPDKMLQGRLFSYGDAQRYRLGVNYHQIPVNAPQCPFHSYHRDGAMRVDGNRRRARTNYEPNSQGEWQDQPDFRRAAAADRGRGRRIGTTGTTTDYYSQPGALFRLMTPGPAAGAVREHRRARSGASQPSQGTAHRQLHQGRSGLRRGRRQGLGFLRDPADGWGNDPASIVLSRTEYGHDGQHRRH